MVAAHVLPYVTWFVVCAPRALDVDMVYILCAEMKHMWAVFMSVPTRARLSRREKCAPLQ
jgi:hypothetical protein